MGEMNKRMGLTMSGHSLGNGHKSNGVGGSGSWATTNMMIENQECAWVKMGLKIHFVSRKMTCEFSDEIFR